MDTKAKQVVVLGAGYAGLMAAMRLARKTSSSRAAITLVNGDSTFGERVRNHQLAAGQPLMRHPIAGFLRGTRIKFVQGTVTGLDLGRRRVSLQADGQSRLLDYDILVYALGSHINAAGVPGAQANAYSLDQGPAAQLAERLPGLANRQGRLLVVGGGNTGLEGATELAESYPALKVTLATRRSFARQLSPGAQAYLRRSLKRLGIQFLEQTEVTEVQPGMAFTAGGEAIPFDACLWLAGFAVPDLARRAGLAVNERGQISIDRAMRSVSHPEVYAVGDAAHPVEDPGTPVRMSLYSAIMMGGHGADCVAALINGQQAPPFGLSYVALGLSLGRRDGVWQFLDWNKGTPLNLNYYGRTANWSREFFVRFALWAIRVQRFAPWVFEWPGRRKMRRAAGQLSRPASRAPRVREAASSYER